MKHHFTALDIVPASLLLAGCWYIGPTTTLEIAAFVASAAVAHRIMRWLVPRNITIGLDPSGAAAAAAASKNNVGFKEARLSAKGEPFMVSVFYPTEIRPLYPYPWQPDGNNSHYAGGLAKYVGVPKALFKHFGSIKMAVTKNAEPAPFVLGLQGQEQRGNETVGAARSAEYKVPVVIYSHGLAGHRNIASVLCQRVASNGCIVIAVGHEDGSASYAECKKTFYDKPAGGWSTRELRYRVEEVRQAVEFAKGDMLRYLHTSSKFVDTERMIFVGHSFGGATGMHAAPVIPEIHQAVLMDPWMEPIARQDLPKAPVAKKITVIDSQQWVDWTPNREEETKIFSSHFTNAEIQDFPGTDHLSASDIGVLLPVLGRKTLKYKMQGKKWRSDLNGVVAEWGDLIANIAYTSTKR